MRNPTYAGAGGDPDVPAITVVDDDKARKVTWDLAKFLNFLLQNTPYIKLKWQMHRLLFLYFV